jgi:hypothetical protein
MQKVSMSIKHYALSTIIGIAVDIQMFGMIQRLGCVCLALLGYSIRWHSVMSQILMTNYD